MDATQLPLDQLIAIVESATRHVIIPRSEHVASYAVFVYDWLLTLETERDIMSTPGFSPVKLAYAFCRYWPLVFQPITLWVQVASTGPICDSIFQIPLYLTTFNFAGAAGVLLVRLYAFNGTRVLLVLALSVLALVVVIFQLYTASQRTRLAPFAPACFPTDLNDEERWLTGFFLAPLLFDMIVILAFIYVAARSNLRFFLASGAVRVFVNEGLLYFFAISIVHGINACFSYQTNQVISGSVVPFSMMLPNLLACRLVINLRQAVTASKASEHPDAKREIVDPSTEGDGTSHVRRATDVELAMGTVSSASFPISMVSRSSDSRNVLLSFATSSLASESDSGQVLLAPPREKGIYISPRLKMFSGNTQPEPPMGRSPISPAQRWPSGVHQSGYTDSPLSPFRQRVPSEEREQPPGLGAPSLHLDRERAHAYTSADGRMVMYPLAGLDSDAVRRDGRQTPGASYITSER